MPDLQHATPASLRPHRGDVASGDQLLISGDEDHNVGQAGNGGRASRANWSNGLSVSGHRSLYGRLQWPTCHRSGLRSRGPFATEAVWKRLSSCTTRVPSSAWPVRSDPQSGTTSKQRQQLKSGLCGRLPDRKPVLHLGCEVRQHAYVRPVCAGRLACWPIWIALTRASANNRTCKFNTLIRHISSRSNLFAIMQFCLRSLVKGFSG